MSCVSRAPYVVQTRNAILITLRTPIIARGLIHRKRDELNGVSVVKKFVNVLCFWFFRVLPFPEKTKLKCSICMVYIYNILDMVHIISIITRFGVFPVDEKTRRCESDNGRLLQDHKKINSIIQPAKREGGNRGKSFWGQMLKFSEWKHFVG